LERSPGGKQEIGPRGTENFKSKDNKL